MIWKSFLTFDFDEKNFKTRGESQVLQFLKFVETSLVTRLAPFGYIQKFRLSMTSFDSKKMTRRLDRWLASVVSKNVREIEIHLVTRKFKRYSVPQSVLVSESLTTLKLCGCYLYDCENIKLPNLEKFSIKGMQIDTNIVERFVSSCPSIEDLRLVECRGLTNLHISTLLKLNRVEIYNCDELSSVQISAPNLQIFWFSHTLFRKCTLDLDRCHDLRSLTLRHTDITDTIFQDLVSKFPVLETLVLNECNKLTSLTILSRKLERLVLVRCTNLIDTVVDAPNLRYLEFNGSNIETLSCINAPNLHDAKICFMPKREVMFNLKKVFGNITEIKGLKLILSCNNEDIVIYEELEAFPDIELSPLEDYKLELKSPLISSIEHLENLLHVTHPMTITVISPSRSNNLLKFLQEKMMNREESLNCCTYYSKKCWKHYLEKVNTLSEIKVSCPGNKNLEMTAFSLQWGSTANK